MTSHFFLALQWLMMAQAHSVLVAAACAHEYSLDVSICGPVSGLASQVCNSRNWMLLQLSSIAQISLWYKAAEVTLHRAEVLLTVPSVRP